MNFYKLNVYEGGVLITKLVSIIIPLYNAEKYIESTIKSILNQSYECLEIIVIDDGSTDKSFEICENFLYDSRLKLYRQNNKGAPTARNKGIDLATGEYILFFDADDILLENSIRDMVDLIQLEQSELVIGNYSTFLGEHIINSNTQKLNRVARNKYNLYFISPFPNNKLYLSKIIKDNKIYFDNVKIAQDANFFYKIIPFINKVSLLNENVCMYRLSENSISRVYSDRILDVLNSMKYVEDFYIEIKVSSEFQQYLSIAKLSHINTQLCKTVLFDDFEEGKKCYIILSQEFRKNLFKVRKLSLVYFKVLAFRIANVLKHYKKIALYTSSDNTKYK